MLHGVKQRPLPIDEILAGRSARWVHRNGGCEPRALARIRAGLPVRSDTMERLARALGLPVGTVAGAVAATRAALGARS